MRNNFNCFLIIVLLFSGCAGNASNPPSAAVAGPTIEMTVDGKKANITSESIVLFNFVDGHHFGISVMSEAGDFQFTTVAWLDELKPGTYEVFSCKGPSECEAELETHNQLAVYGPYPKDPMPPLSLSRIAYRANALALSPLKLVFSEIKDEQQAGVPWKTKRVIGSFQGTLAYVEKNAADQWEVKSKTKIEGKFNDYCGIR